jgi:hypothetical protein
MKRSLVAAPLSFSQESEKEGTVVVAERNHMRSERAPFADLRPLINTFVEDLGATL